MTIRFYSEESVPVEMHRARIVQKLQLLTIEERLEKIQEAGNNTFLLYNKDIYLDMLTDSGVNAMSDEMQAAMFVADDSYAGSSTYLKMANKLKEIFDMNYFLPAHQGRACEHILVKRFVKKMDIIPMNVRFDSIKEFISQAGAQYVELITTEALVVNSNNPFKGNFDLDKLENILKEHCGKNIPFIRIEAGSNLIGGQPLSLENIKQVSEIAKKYNVLVVLDASLLQDNLYFIKQREEKYQSLTIREITKEISKVVDIIYFSARKLGFAIKRTMNIAQGLYEGVKVPEKGSVGLITYMRTDSTRISEEARAAAKVHITEKYGANYYENRYYKTKAGAQDAHEGIRPTYIELTPEKIKDSLTPEQFKLYRLIYNRFIASQMSAAVYDTITANIDTNTENGVYNFRASGQTLKFKGFMTLYVEGTDSKEEEKEGMLPDIKEKEELKLVKIDPKQSFTEPPPRYTEASLVKTLEEKGIGRPSTYSPTITTILDRRYIEKEQKQLIPTELGKVVNKLLVENFSDVVNVEFTANIENQFDNIAEGKENWRKMISDFYGPFEENLEKVEKELEHVEMVEEVSDVKCEKCGRMMVYKYGKFGKFLACPGYPECKNTKAIVETVDVPCPKCGGTVQVRRAKNKKKYYICENNPKSCDYISWNKPTKNEDKNK